MQKVLFMVIMHYELKRIFRVASSEYKGASLIFLVIDNLMMDPSKTLDSEVHGLVLSLVLKQHSVTIIPSELNWLLQLM